MSVDAAAVAMPAPLPSSAWNITTVMVAPRAAVEHDGGAEFRAPP